MTFADLVGKFLDIINLAVPALFALTIAFVFWKIVKAWIIDGGEAGIESGKQTVLVAVIALVVMIGVWGIVEILRTSLGLN